MDINSEEGLSFNQHFGLDTALVFHPTAEVEQKFCHMNALGGTMHFSVTTFLAF